MLDEGRHGDAEPQVRTARRRGRPVWGPVPGRARGHRTKRVDLSTAPGLAASGPVPPPAGAKTARLRFRRERPTRPDPGLGFRAAPAHPAVVANVPVRERRGCG